MFVFWYIDYASKEWALQNVNPGSLFSYFFDTIRFRLTLNRGGAFGIAQGYSSVFHILTGLGIIFLLYFFITTKNKNVLFFGSMGFVFSGAFGNFTDRFFREGVVDFIEMGFQNFRYPYIYNLADIFIFLGAVGLFFFFHKQDKLERKLKEEKSTEPTTPSDSNKLDKNS